VGIPPASPAQLYTPGIKGLPLIMFEKVSFVSELAYQVVRKAGYPGGTEALPEQFVWRDGWRRLESTA